MEPDDNVELPLIDFSFPLDHPLYRSARPLVRELHKVGYNTYMTVPQRLDDAPSNGAVTAVYGAQSPDERMTWTLGIRFFRMRAWSSPEYDDLGAELRLSHYRNAAEGVPAIYSMAPDSVISFDQLIGGAGGMSRGLFLDAAQKALRFVRERMVND